MRRETLALVLLAQRDAILPSARVVDVAALVRRRYPRDALGPDLRQVLGRGAPPPPPPPGRDVVGEAAAAIFHAAGDEKLFKKLLKSALGGKRKGGAAPQAVKVEG